MLRYKEYERSDSVEHHAWLDEHYRIHSNMLEPQPYRDDPVITAGVSSRDHNGILDVSRLYLSVPQAQELVEHLTESIEEAKVYQ